MKTISYSKKPKGAGNYEPDAIYEDTLFEFAYKLHNIRGVQSVLVSLAKVLAEQVEKNAMLLLNDSRISPKRLRDEWKAMSRIFHPGIFSRLGIIRFANGKQSAYMGIADDSILQVAQVIREKLHFERKSSLERKKQDAYYEILHALLVNWFRKTGPLQIKQLSEVTGYSYPTIGTALGRIEKVLIRHTDRRIELRSFPTEEWFRLVSKSREIRQSKGYTANHQRPVEQLLDRLRQHNDKDLALGGIMGARNYMPGINLIGIHRLDLSFHNWQENRIEDMIHQLDPGLREARSGELPQLVTHRLFTTDSFFQASNEGYYADEVDCLLDLHEAKLEGQATEFLDHLKRNATA
ncbi:MAG: hypothetical protein P1P86_16305 [Bacteroidales bacterium]|nr:hypothetical protein [Bacteroidales bacterium]